MEHKKINKVFHPEGNIENELLEIKRMRDQSVYIYTIVTNTCTPFLSIMCC